jgi:TolB-like protein/Tfp pilus assembly protein PilF
VLLRGAKVPEARSASPIRFGIFELDTRAAELRRKGSKVRLQRQSFEILLLLIEHPGELVTRKEIRERLWPAGNFVDFEHSLNTAMMKLRQALAEGSGAPFYIETIPRLGYRFIAPVRDPSRDSTSFQSIAVLPLENLSGEPQQEYFADGMTEELITQLAQLGFSRVISRTSVMRYKHAGVALPKIAEELQVQAVVEGSVQRAGDRVRITAQLIDAVNDRHLWAAKYDRDFQDILALQAEIASAIAESVCVKVGHQSRERAAIRPIRPEAYDNFLKGNYFRAQRSPIALQKAKEHYSQSVACEPEWAPPYAYLAGTYFLLNIVEVLPPSEAYPHAKTAAERAIQLDVGLAEAHAALGAIKARYEWNCAGADKEFQLALSLNPNSANTRLTYSASLLIQTGRFHDALNQVNAAMSLDPNSVLVRSLRGWCLYLARRYDDALKQLHEALDMDCNFAFGQFTCGFVCMQKGMLDEALSCFQEACRLTRSQPQIIAGLGHLYGYLGRIAEAQKTVEELLTLQRSRYVAPTSFALALVTQDRPAETMNWLEKAAEDRDPILPVLVHYPAFDAYRRQVRFTNLMQKMR